MAKGAEAVTPGQVAAEQALQAGGSIMANRRPEWYYNLPNNLGPTAGTAVQAGVNVLDKLAALGPSPLDAAGGGGSQAAGVFRELGILRKGGQLTPAQYVEKLAELPKAARFEHLSQLAVKNKLGPEFSVARGATINDPLVKALMAGQEAPATAVAASGVPKWLAQDMAENFARGMAESMRKPSFVASGIATPKDVVGLLPTRKAPFPQELEYILKPGGFQGDLSAKFIPPDKMVPFAERKELRDINDIAKQIMTRKMK